MKLIPHFLVLFGCGFLSLSVPAQSYSSEVKAAQKMVNEEQKVFRDFLVTVPVYTNIKSSLQKFAVNDVNGLQDNLQFLATASKDKRIKAIRSLSYFMKEIQQQLSEKKINQFDIQEIIKKYKQTLNDLLSRKNIDAVDKNFKNLNWHSCQLLANSFWEFAEKKQMADISAYKRVTETPEHIFSFLESTPGFYYRDSLIIFMTKNYPEQVLSYVQKNNNDITSATRNQKNVYIQQLLSFSSNSLATELAPFTEQITDNELTIDDILIKRKNVNEYFQLLVNTVMSNEQKNERGDDPEFQAALANALSGKSLDFYIKKINDLHSSADAARFQSVQSLRPQDLYYIIVSADQEMYTSTYLGLYKRLLSNFKDQSADSILNLVHNDQFRKFMRIAATYNTLSDFLQHMSSERSRELIHLFVSGIENDDEDKAIANATDVADAFITFSKDPVFNAAVRQELEDGLKGSQKNNLYQSVRLYSILRQVYELVNNNQSGELSDSYKGLSFSSLKDHGVTSELVLFYGDEDGKGSYNSFMNIFKDKSKWEVSTNEAWVTISSLQGQPIKVYANLPLETEDEKDLAAQEALAKYLEKESVQPSILIHRGHSYHLPNTLKYLNSSVKLAILGSCGGYKNMKKIMELNPDVHIIASKQVGSMAVNDPLLYHLNSDLAEGKNIDWIVFWKELSEGFKNDPNASKLFEEYIPPYKNVSSYVIKLYKYHDDEPGTEQ